MAGGRPTKYNPEIVARILERIADGESLRAICCDPEMPARSSVFKWLSENKAFSDQYARAREAQADALFDEMLDIADDGSNDWMLKNQNPGAGWVENGEALRRSALRVDARKWIVSKLLPKKYGDRVVNQVVGPNDGPVQTEDKSDILQVARQTAFILAKAAALKGD